MPFGHLPITNNPIPQHDPPYSIDTAPTFSSVTLLVIRYRTSFASISRLIPDVLEVDDEPLITATLLNYGVSPGGPFKELIHTVEARYRGQTYDFTLSLILDSEIGVLAGREPTGFPKRMGRLDLVASTEGATTGYVERPVGQRLVDFTFEAKAQLDPPPKLDKRFLNLRVIPSPVKGAPASVKDLVPVDFDIRPVEVWEGVGELVFPEEVAGNEAVNRIEIVRYEDAMLGFGAACLLHPSKEVFPL